MWVDEKGNGLVIEVRVWVLVIMEFVIGWGWNVVFVE